MWGATIAPPRYKESYIVTMVDKYCAVKEASEPMTQAMKANGNNGFGINNDQHISNKTGKRLESVVIYQIPGAFCMVVKQLIVVLMIPFKGHTYASFQRKIRE